MDKISVTILEAAEMTGLSRSTFYKLFREKKLAPHKSGKRVLILVKDLEQYIRGLPTL